MRNRKRKFLDVKKNAEAAHFKKRLIQRYGIFFNNLDKRKMISDIQNQENGAHFLFAQSHSRSIWSINIRGIEIPVVYVKKRQSLVTALTWDMLEKT